MASTRAVIRAQLPSFKPGIVARVRHGRCRALYTVFKCLIAAAIQVVLLILTSSGTMRPVFLGTIATVVAAVVACGGSDASCYGPLKDDVVLTRNVRRMQPDAQNTTTKPRGPLEWGQINFLHTTDTHGWLEGHLKEQNYGADWGDYVSFTK